MSQTAESPVKLLVTILDRPEHLHDVLLAFLEIGLGGSTVVDSVGMGRILSHDVPIFAGLRSAFPGSSPSNKTILTLANERQIADAVAVLKDVYGTFEAPGTGVSFVVPVEIIWGAVTGLVQRP